MGDGEVVFDHVEGGEAFAGDILRFEVAAGEPGPNGFRLFYRITRPEDDSAIAMAETGMVCFDYRTRRIQSLPDVVRTICVDTGMGKTF